MTTSGNLFRRACRPIVRKIQKMVGGKRLAKLEETERLYYEFVDAFNTVSLAIIITDNSGRIAFANKRMLELIQHTKNKHLSEALHPDDQQAYLDFRNSVMATGNDGAIDVRYLDPSGGVRWLRVSALPVHRKKPEPETVLPYIATIEDITDHKADQEKIRLSEEKYRTILDTISDQYWETDLKGRFIFWNKAFEINTGLSPAEIMTLKPEDYIAKASYGKMMLTHHQVFKSGEPALVEIDNFYINTEQHKYEKKTVLNSVHLKNDESGSPVGFFGFTRDISALKKAEQSLRESKENFKLISDQSLLGISIIQDNKSVYRNDAMVKILGYSHEELNERFDSSFLYNHLLHPDSREFAIKQYEMKQEGKLSGQIYNYQHKILTKKGDVKWVDQYSKTVTYNGEPADMVTMVDITNQKKAEEDLLASQYRLAAHIESTPMGVIEFDNHFIITAWNPAAERIFGFSRDAAIGSNIFDFLVPDYDLQNVRNVHVLSDPKPGKNINDNLTRDGRIITVQWFNTPIWDIHGNLTGMAAACQDITEQLQTQKMLIQSEKMISVGGLAAGMAHEINNPLGAILQVSQNMRRRLAPDFDKNLAVAEKYHLNLEDMHGYLEERGISGYLDAIMASGKRAARIISDMLHFSRNSETQIIPVNLNDLIDRSVELAATDYDLKKKYDFRHITIERVFDPDLTSVPCSETEIEQVMLNLLKNCAQSMGTLKDKDAQQITLRTIKERDMARIEIEDNGPGMETEVISRIFEPFFTTKPVGEGTGLGLSVSYTIITANHKGTMEVVSEPGKGARFIIRLPLQQEPTMKTVLNHKK